MSLLDQISRKVEGNESRGEGEAEEEEEEREREQGSGKVEKERAKEEAKGNLACGLGNVITVYSDLLWFLPTRYLILPAIITTGPTDHEGV